MKSVFVCSVRFGVISISRVYLEKETEHTFTVKKKAVIVGFESHFSNHHDLKRAYHIVDTWEEAQKWANRAAKVRLSKHQKEISSLTEQLEAINEINIL